MEIQIFMKFRPGDLASAEIRDVRKNWVSIPPAAFHVKIKMAADLRKYLQDVWANLAKSLSLILTLTEYLTCLST